MEGGCLGYLGASTVASQPLDRILSLWLANPLNPAMSPHSRHPSHWWNGGRKKNKGWEGGKTLNEPLHRALHKRSMKKLADPSSVQSYHIPCDLTAGCLLSSWATWPLSLWTAKLVDRLIAKLVNHSTAKLENRLTCKLMNLLSAKLVDRLTVKLVVVNLVKLHLTKFKKAFVDLSTRLKENSKSTSSYLLRL